MEVAWEAPAGSDAATTKGPLNPGPKPSASRSYATLVVVPAGWFPSSETPRCRASVGTASATRRARPNTVPATGWRWTTPLQREARVGRSRPGDRRCTDQASMRRPAKPSSAGSSVTAASTATSTALDTPTASP